MKKFVLSMSLLCLSTAVCFSQNKKLPARSNAVKETTVKPFAEIPDADWIDLITAVQTENWEKSLTLANGYLTKIKAENEKKQLARLRYISLYALAGKIAEASAANKNAEEAKARIELEQTAKNFLGKEFFMPSREILKDCTEKLNFICRSKQQRNVLRVTATNQSGTAIFSFEYVRLKEDFGILRNTGKQAIVSGILSKIEFNPNNSNVWIMRLFFEQGAINIVPDE